MGGAQSSPGEEDWRSGRAAQDSKLLPSRNYAQFLFGCAASVKWSGLDECVCVAKRLSLGGGFQGLKVAACT